MTNRLYATIKLDDYEAARDILHILKAPVNQANIDNIKSLVAEVGEMYEEAYNKMLKGIAENKLTSYGVKCQCGAKFTINVTEKDVWDTIPTGGAN